MKEILFLLLISPICLFSQNYQYERIVSYHSDLEVQQNCDLIVTETIKVYAGGSQIQRGIFRDLPLTYDYKGGNVKVGFKLLDIKRDGHPEPHHTEWLSNGIRIYIGDADIFLNSGFYTYEIKYRVDHVLGFFEDYDEIYWNINGNGWGFSIDSISARVTFPKEAKLVQFDGYTGHYGSVDKNFTAQEEGNSVFYRGSSKLNSGESLTVAVAWEKNHLIYPSATENFWFWVKSYMLWVIGIIALIIGFAHNFVMWYKYGRDPKPGTIIPRYYPPEGFSPAECYYLNNNGIKHDSMFGAQLVGLAVKRHITIKVTGKSPSSYTYYISKNNTDERKEELNDVETKFLANLFGRKDTLTISKKYNTRVSHALDELVDSINTKQVDKYFVRNTHLKVRQYIFPILTLAAGILAYWHFGGAIWVMVLTFIILIVKNLIFTRLYEQPTAEGRKKMDEIAGFAMYMKYADKLRINALNPPTMDFTHFEKNLPYAIALGVVDNWKNQFPVATIQDGYTHRMPYMHGVSLAYLSTFTQSLNTTISSASTPPSSSGSGSGGGGFSGGGGGGGGGGGW